MVRFLIHVLSFIHLNKKTLIYAFYTTIVLMVAIFLQAAVSGSFSFGSWVAARGSANAARLEKSSVWSVIFVCFASFFSLTLSFISPAWRIAGGGMYTDVAAEYRCGIGVGMSWVESSRRCGRLFFLRMLHASNKQSGSIASFIAYLVIIFRALVYLY